MFEKGNKERKSDRKFICIIVWEKLVLKVNDFNRPRMKQQQSGCLFYRKRFRCPCNTKLRLTTLKKVPLEKSMTYQGHLNLRHANRAMRSCRQPIKGNLFSREVEFNTAVVLTSFCSCVI